MEYVFYLEAFCEALRDVNHVDVPNDTDISRVTDCRVKLGHAEVLASVCAKLSPQEAHVYNICRSIIKTRSEEKILILNNLTNVMTTMKNNTTNNTNKMTTADEKEGRKKDVRLNENDMKDAISIASVYVLCAFNAKSANDMMFYIY